MTTKTKTRATRTEKETANLSALGLPALWERFKEATGESTRSPNKKFLVRRIEEALAARVATTTPTLEQTPPPVHRIARASELSQPSEPTHPAESATPRQRGRFASMTIEELQARYRDVVGRDTSSSARDYLVWKIREAEKGRISVGPRKTRARDGDPLDVKILPLRLEADIADEMDEAWRAKGIRNRMEFLRRAIAHYLSHLGAHETSARFVAE